MNELLPDFAMVQKSIGIYGYADFGTNIWKTFMFRLS